jgi:hypothetical protein
VIGGLEKHFLPLPELALGGSDDLTDETEYEYKTALNRSVAKVI